MRYASSSNLYTHLFIYEAIRGAGHKCVSVNVVGSNSTQEMKYLFKFIFSLLPFPIVEAKRGVEFCHAKPLEYRVTLIKKSVYTR